MIGRHGPTLRHKPTQAQLPVISPVGPPHLASSLGVKEGSSRRSLCQKIQTGRTVTRRLLPPCRQTDAPCTAGLGPCPPAPRCWGPLAPKGGEGNPGERRYLFVLGRYQITRGAHLAAIYRLGHRCLAPTGLFPEHRRTARPRTGLSSGSG